MVYHLGIPQFLVLPRKFIMNMAQLFLNYCLGIVQLPYFFIDAFKFFLQLLNRFFLLGFVRFCPQQPGSKLSFTDIYLLHHRIKTPDFGFYGSTAVQRINDSVLPRFDVIVQLFDFILNGTQQAPGLIPYCFHLGQLPVNLVFIL